jgi:hypothetical protein
VAVNLPLMLHDINAGGFAAVATDKLTRGAAYDLRFALYPETIALKARLVHATRTRGDQGTGYLLGFEFVDATLDKPAIDTLIAAATRAAH